MINAQNIHERIILSRNKRVTVESVPGGFALSALTSISELFATTQDSSIVDPENYQNYFRLRMSLNKTTFFPGETLRINADMDYLLDDPPTVPMVFGVFVQIPTGEVIYSFPVPGSNPGMRIAQPVPFGNDTEWETGHDYIDEMTSALWDDSAGGAWGAGIIPLLFHDAYPVGTYRFQIMSFLLWENELFAISWDEKTCVFTAPPSTIYTLPTLNRPLINDHARLEPTDLQLLAKLPRASTALGLAIATAGQNASIGGLTLGIGVDQIGEYVYINPGVGVIYANIDDIQGSHPIIVPEPVPVGYFSSNIPDPGVVRYDPIAIGLDVITEGIEDGSDGDGRVFIYPSAIDPETGSPKRKLINVPTRSKYIAITKWISGVSDPVAAMDLLPPDGYMVLGWVSNSQDQAEHAVVNREFDPVVVPQHRSKSPLDHPDRSILAEHIESSVIGDFETGRDMTMKSMSDQIVDASGNKTSIHERIESLITEDGTIVEEPIIDLIDAQLTDLFSGVVDSKGNLMSSALTGSGVLATAAAVMGIAPDEGFVALPHGFSQDQCAWIIGLSQIAFTPGSQGVPAEYISITCTCNGRRVRCFSTVVYSSNENRELPGSANFLTIGFESN